MTTTARPVYVRLVLKLSVPAILERRVTAAIFAMLNRLAVDRAHVSLTRGEYVLPAEGRPMPRLTHRRVILPEPNNGGREK